VNEKIFFMRWLNRSHDSIGDLISPQRCRIFRTFSAIDEDLGRLSGLYRSIPPAIARYIDLGNLNEQELSALGQISARAECGAASADELISQVKIVKDGLQKLPAGFWPLLKN